ncbi:MAG TPA: prepilin-type N-terminal cleavage/methylation domain-containing protein [Bacilli bacterium]|mgnify:CR=1 FL=1|nr:prepilin-type N-terminal cleavage/methylation domain-containing protein [Bacilli bacterium]
MKNRKGFTLIELLAVIVILAIILLIAVPQVTQIINKSRQDAFAASYRMVLKQIDYYSLQGDLDTYDGTGQEANYDLDADQYDLTVASAGSGAYTVTLAPDADGDFKDIDMNGYCADLTEITSSTCNTSGITGTYVPPTE